MKRSASLFFLLQAFVLNVLLTLSLEAQMVKFTEPISEEKVINADIKVGSIHLVLKSHQSPQVYQYHSKSNLPVQLSTNYFVKNANGYLTINTRQKHASARHKMIGWELFGDISHDDHSIAPLNLSLTDSLPLKLNISVGSSNSEFDLSGLKLSKLNMNIGACNSKVVFSRKNPITLKHMHVSTGASQLFLTGLGHANFDKFTFNGGITDVTMDFEGKIKKKAKIDITIDAGNMSILIPKDVGIKLNHSSHFFSNVSLPEDFQKSKGIYYSKNYGKTKGSLIMFLKSGAGSVDISWKN